MSFYKTQEYDFIIRTKTILDQYEKFSLIPEEKFEVTLLLNCLVGLIILPQQHWFQFLPNDIISKKYWGIEPNQITYIKTNDKKSVDIIARHIRNSLAHYRFTVFSNNKGEINEIKFEDYDPQNKKTFKAIIPIEDLKIFANKFSSFLINEMENQK